MQNPAVRCLPIREFWEPFNPLGFDKGTFVLFTGYMDESYDGAKQNLFVFSCLLAKGKLWTELVRAWKLQIDAVNRQFYKRKSQEKKFPLWAGILLLSSPFEMSRICFDRPHHLLGSWTAKAQPLGFPTWRFSLHGLATKPVSSETCKAERRSYGDHGSIWDSWAHSFFWLSERA